MAITHAPARARIAAVLSDLGWVASDRGEVELATERLREALVIAREIGFTWLVALSNQHLGTVFAEHGEAAPAWDCFRESHAIALEHGDPRVLAQTVEGLAALIVTAGRIPDGAYLFGVAAALRDAIGAPKVWSRSRDYDRALAYVRKADREHEFLAARERGRNLTLTQALVEANRLAELARSFPAAVDRQPSVHGLSPRESEVLRLIAAGRSNADIANALFISLRTVTTHASNILNKTGCASRAELISFAHREGLA